MVRWAEELVRSIDAPPRAGLVPPLLRERFPMDIALLSGVRVLLRVCGRAVFEEKGSLLVAISAAGLMSALGSNPASLPTLRSMLRRSTAL